MLLFLQIWIPKSLWFHVNAEGDEVKTSTWHSHLIFWQRRWTKHLQINCPLHHLTGCNSSSTLYDCCFQERLSKGIRLIEKYFVNDDVFTPILSINDVSYLPLLEKTSTGSHLISCLVECTFWVCCLVTMYPPSFRFYQDAVFVRTNRILT